MSTTTPLVDTRARMRLRNLARKISDVATGEKGGVANVMATLDHIEAAVLDARASVGRLAGDITEGKRPT